MIYIYICTYHIYIFKKQHTHTNPVLHNQHTIIDMPVVVIPIIILTQDSNPPLSESRSVSILAPVTLGFIMISLGVCSYMLRVSYRVFCRVALCSFCRVAFCSFCVYTCESKSIAGVPKGLFRATLLLCTTRMCSRRLGV